MGVPALFRWLQRRYPLIISNCIEEEITDPAEFSNQNPNTYGDTDFDNLYLDMNNIIHPCFHPEGVASPKTEEELYASIENYINRLFNIVRPRKLLYMAIDGVAPRAKMNQQRARRYRAAKESIFHYLIKVSDAERKHDEEMLQLLNSPTYLQEHDTNVITPGTTFLYRLANHLREFIKRQQEQIPAWHNISVILSDASVPGEGEHKIMDFIRGQRLESGYDPNHRHCIYGLDADLIFLGLGSHEPYFTILREKLFDESDSYHFLNVWILRQYIEKDLKPNNLKFEWNFEKAIDDIIFLCYAAGNDFLPNVPGFNVATGIFGAIMAEYRHCLPTFDGYITDDEGVTHFDRMIKVLSNLNKFEEKTLNHILHPSEAAIAAQKHVNEICNTNHLKLEKMEYADLKSKSDEKTQEVIEETPVVVPCSELKEEYYKTKFGENAKIPHIVFEYVRGMYWTFKYYNHGCPSWSWFYPYNHAPCVSDFKLLENYEITFELGEPFPPLVQLMAVLPPQSSFCLPQKMANLMTSRDSPLREFYPTKFTIDLNGGLTTWKGAVNIPFIDADALLSTINNIDLQLTEEEQARNVFGRTRIYVQNVDESKFFQFYGELTEISHPEYFYDYRIVPNDANLSFLLLNIKMPPNVINDNRYIPHKSNSKLFNKLKANATKEMPLEIPGVPPGQPQDYRINKVRFGSSQNKPANKKFGTSSAFLF